MAIPTRLINAYQAQNIFIEFFHIRKPQQLAAQRQAFALVPTIDAEPVRHGKFIGTEYGYIDGNPVYYGWKCSECGCVFEGEEPTYKYCPNCGCRMDEE